MAEQANRALYLTWRPSTFEDVVGQGHVVRTLRNAIRAGNIGHAYLFSGPRGTGKTTMARLLYKAVNCLSPQDGAPCEQCGICQTANEGRALDLFELDAASNRGIDDVRDIRERINYAPAEARYRVYILDEAHQLTQAAWDALLKTLEEPPPHAILVLATTESHRVPATVISRCQRFDFRRISAGDIRNRLAQIAGQEGLTVEPTVINWLARVARGGMRDAISLLDQLRSFCGDTLDEEGAREVLGLAGLETVSELLDALREERLGDALDLLHNALERGADLRVFVTDVVGYLRAMLLLRHGAKAALRSELPAEEIDWLETQAPAWQAQQLRELVSGLGDALARFRDPAQLELQVELVLLDHAETAMDAPDPYATPAPPLRAAPARPAEPEPRPVPATPVVDRVPAASLPAAPVSPAPATHDDEPTPSASDPRLATAPERVAVSAESEVETATSIAEEPAPALVEEPPRAEDVPSEPADSVPESPVGVDPSEIAARWPLIHARVCSANPGWSWFHNCQLSKVDGSTLVLELSPGLRRLVDGRDRMRALTETLRSSIEEVVGAPMASAPSVRFTDPSQTPRPTDDSASPRPSGAADPVVQAGLRLFGGQLTLVE